MPGTIHVSILELMGLPSLQQSSSMGIKVSMGKQSYDIQEKGDSSFLLASLRDNLSVTIYDSEGSEIGRTGVESRSIVEKGMWDDIFPLQGGGHVRMKLHFILTEEEQKKIRSMRESAARKKQEDLLKRNYSSSDLTVAYGGSSAPRGDSLKTFDKSREGTVNQADRKPYKIISRDSSVNDRSQVHPGQKQQLFLTSKSTGALDKLPDFQRVKKEIPHRTEEQRSQLKKTPSNVRNMILALESSPVKEAPPSSATSKSTTTLLKEPRKAVSVTVEPVLSRLETVHAPILVEKAPEKAEVITDIPLKAPKKTPFVIAKPVLPNLETVGAPILVEKATEKAQVITDSITLKAPMKTPFVSAKPVLPNLETTRAPILVEKVTESAEVITDISLKSQEKLDYVSTKPVLPNLETVRSPILVEKVTERAEVTTNSPVKAPKKALYVNAIPVLSNLETLPTPISEEIVTQQEVIGDYVDSCQETLCSTTAEDSPLKALKKTVSVTTKPVLTDLDSFPTTSEEILQSQPSNEGTSTEAIKSPKELHSRVSVFGGSKGSWKTLSRGLPRHTKRHVSISFDSSVFKKTWKRKRPKSCGNKYYSPGGFRGWIFMEEIIHPCVRSDARPFRDLLDGSYSNFSQDTLSDKLKDEESFDEHRAVDTDERPDRRPHTGRPARQVVNIAIMVGFGILVLLTRQRR